MNIEAELKKDGIEVIERLDLQTINMIAENVSTKICKTFPNFGLDQTDLYNRISSLDMYRATMPEGMSEANYFYKNTSIYFNNHIDDGDLVEFAVHECIHFIQEVKDKKNNLVKMGLCEYEDSKVYGLGMNEAAVQLMASKAIGMEKDFVKYFGVSFETISPSYYPLECCLVEQLAYLFGEDILFESTLNSNDNFKNKFVKDTSLKTYICVQNALDTILDAEENIIKLNNKILEIDERNKKVENLTEKINEIKNEILLTFLRTQNLIISNYFNSSIKNVKTKEQIDEYRNKLYNFKDYLGSTEGYNYYHDFYVEKMTELEHLANVIENGGKETALATQRKDGLFAMILRKLKSLFKRNSVASEEE